MRRRQWRVQLAAAMVFALMAVTATVAPVSAAALIRVTTTVDEVSSNGKCSLREAVIAANEDRRVDACRAGRGADLILLGKGTYQLSIEGIQEDATRTGDLDITGATAIVGLGRDRTIVRGDASDRVFDILESAKVSMTTLAVVGASNMATQEPGLEDWYTHGDGGGIQSKGHLLLWSTSVTGTAYVFAGCRYCWDGEGGGIFNDHGTLVVHNSVIDGKAAYGGGALLSRYGKVRIFDSKLVGDAIEYGSAIELYGTDAAMTRSKVEGSRSSWCCSIITGGPGGTLTIRHSQIVDNVGGIANVGPGRLRIYDTTIARNTGTNSGPFGGVAPSVLSNGGDAKLVRVSVLDNSGTEDSSPISNGGSISLIDSVIARNKGETGAIDSSADGSNLRLVNTTVSGNRGTSYGALRMSSGLLRSSTIVGNMVENDGPAGISIETARIANTVIAGNSGPTASPDCSGVAFGEQGLITSLGAVFLQDGPGCDIVGDTSTNFSGLDPVLGPLTDNGGPTLSHMPMRGSPLIDSGSPLAPGSGAACAPRDQRGVLRPKDGNGDGAARCDIGSIERLIPVSP